MQQRFGCGFQLNPDTPVEQRKRRIIFTTHTIYRALGITLLTVLCDIGFVLMLLVILLTIVQVPRSWRKFRKLNSYFASLANHFKTRTKITTQRKKAAHAHHTEITGDTLSLAGVICAENVRNNTPLPTDLLNIVLEYVDFDMTLTEHEYRQADGNSVAYNMHLLNEGFRGQWLYPFSFCVPSLSSFSRLFCAPIIGHHIVCVCSGLT